MGIDRIGKGGAPPVPDAGALEKRAPVEKAFHVDATREARGVEATSPLARLRTGEIDVDAYVDLKIDEATRGLGVLPPADLAEIKRALRDQLSTDPGLQDLVRAAGGATPSAPED